jgi:hypothetical protein
LPAAKTRFARRYLAVSVDRQIAQKESKVEKLADREKDIQERIKSIEDSGQMLTLKQLENIQTKVYAPTFGKTGIIMSEEDEKNLRATAMAAAKATEQAKKYKGIAKAAYEIIRDIVQAIGLLKFDFRGDNKPMDNLTPEQDILIAAILNHGMEISKNNGYGSLADEMKKAKLAKPLSEKFNRLEEDIRKKNRPSILEAVTQKAKEQDAQNIDAPKANRERKNHGAEL